jgi:hypothetical protein
MLPQQVLVALATALSVSAIPLNINLGAYSPALVVGDGEISFGNSPERASQVLQTLASGAQNGATGQANAQIPPPAPPAAGAPPPLAGERTQEPNGGANINAATAGPGPEFISSRINAGFDPVMKYPNLMARSAVVVSTPAADAEEIHQRQKREIEEIHQRVKRDLDGFRLALAYASDGLRNSPRIELGTENAGIGILQNAGSAVPANSAANGARPAGVARRSVPEGVEEKKLGMTLIAVAEI